MNNVALVYESGEVQWLSSTVPYGVRDKQGKRPVIAYIDETVDTEEKRFILSIALHPEKSEGVRDMYTPASKYLDKGSRLLELEVNNVTHELVYKSREGRMVYDELVDGKALDEEEAKEKYPEEFI